MGDYREIAWHFEGLEATQDLFCSEIDYIFRESAEIFSDLHDPPKKIAVGVSGGSDSLSLLLLLKAWAEQRGASVICITVDHKLREESREEALFVRNICEKIGVKHVILDWEKDSQPSHGKLENLAREARYKLIGDFCERESIEFVAIGHTWSDQLETFEMRKSLKSGDFGLAGMSRVRSLREKVKLIRPLMVFSRELLRDFLREKGIEWKDDPMNEDERFKRVACRKSVRNQGEEELRQKTYIIKSLGKKRADIEGRSVDFLQEHMNSDQVKYGYTILDAFLFREIDEDVQRETLKRIVWNVGGKKYAQDVDDILLKFESQKRVSGSVGRCLIRYSGNQIAVFREDRNLDQKIAVEGDGEFLFDNRFLLEIRGYEAFLEQNKSEFRGEIKEKLTNCMILSRGTLREIKRIKKSDEGRSKLFEHSLPCVMLGGDLVFSYGIFRDTDCGLEISCKFMNKVNLFDIFL